MLGALCVGKFLELGPQGGDFIRGLAILHGGSARPLSEGLARKARGVAVYRGLYDDFALLSWESRFGGIACV